MPPVESVVATDGRLEAYWEQGWEGRIDFAFLADGADFPHLLGQGDRLAILDDQGGTLWDGRIHFLPLRWWDRRPKDIDVWSHVKQKGVPYAQWMAWFWRTRPLRARLWAAPPQGDPP